MRRAIRTHSQSTPYWAQEVAGYFALFLFTCCAKLMAYISATFLCGGTGTGSTSGYRICDDLSILIPLLLDLLVPLLFIALSVLLSAKCKPQVVFRVLCFASYSVYALVSPFLLSQLWQTPYFMSWP